MQNFIQCGTKLATRDPFRSNPGVFYHCYFTLIVHIDHRGLHLVLTTPCMAFTLRIPFSIIYLGAFLFVFLLFLFLSTIDFVVLHRRARSELDLDTCMVAHANHILRNFFFFHILPAIFPVLQ